MGTVPPIDAQGNSRVFTVDDGNLAGSIQVTLEKITLTGGYANGSEGGGIRNLETLTVGRSTIVGNQAAAGDGGGIYSSGSLTILSSTVFDNSARSGGGIFGTGATELKNTTISGNTAQRGGGIQNTAPGDLRIYNSTITQNESDPEEGSGVVSAGNLADPPARVEVESSIIAGNRYDNDVACYVGCGNPFVSSGHNLIGGGNASSSFTNEDQTGITDPGLRPLANNGGVTPTHALLPESLAIESGSNRLQLTEEQRGGPFAREVDGDRDGMADPDVGAVEFADIDGDGLPNVWESQNYGIDVDGDGDYELDLYALGARPDHKDVFVEVDYMMGRAPLTQTPVPTRVADEGLATGTVLDNVILSFLNAPVSNPDGATGIKLHIEIDLTGSHDVIPRQTFVMCRSPIFCTNHSRTPESS